MAEYERRCAEMLETATDNAKAAMPPAIDRLRGIIDDDQQQPQQHIAAARAVLEYGLRLVEANDFDQRLRALEERSQKRTVKSDTLTRLKRLEDAIKAGSGVLIVDAVPGGYRLPNGETVKYLDALRNQYSVIIIDDLTESE